MHNYGTKQGYLTSGLRSALGVLRLALLLCVLPIYGLYALAKRTHERKAANTKTPQA